MFPYIIIGPHLQLDSIPQTDFFDVMGCVDRAANCDKVMTCLGAVLDKPCDPDSFMDRCDGTILVECGGAGGASVETRQDCRVMVDNNLCFLDEDGDGQCGVALCDGDEEKCVGDVAESCDWGVLNRFDCGRSGAECHVFDGEAGCLAGGSCESDFCDGDYAVGCVGGVQALPLDCDWFHPDLTCRIEPAEDEWEEDDAVCSVPEGQEECLTYSDEGSRCNGNLAEVCHGGAWIAFDCGQLPGAKCQLAEGGWFEDDVECVVDP